MKHVDAAWKVIVVCVIAAVLALPIAAQTKPICESDVSAPVGRPGPSIIHRIRYSIPGSPTRDAVLLPYIYKGKVKLEIYQSGEEIPHVFDFPSEQALKDYVKSVCEGTAPLPPVTVAQSAVRAATASTSVPASGHGALRATVANLDGNGLFGVATLSPGGPSILAVSLQKTDGTFASTGRYPVDPTAEFVIAADFNGDGNADLAVSSPGNFTSNLGSISIFLGRGDGTFAPPITVPAGADPESLDVADFNRDGKLDIAVTTAHQTVSVLLGNGDGTFKAPVTYPVGPTVPSSLVAVDLNGDGVPDIATGGGLSATIAVLIANGDGTFKPTMISPAPTGNLVYLGWMDLNHDGKNDLIVGNFVEDSIAFLFGKGDGTFQTPVQYVAGTSPSSFALVPANNGALLFTSDKLTGDLIEMEIGSDGTMAAPLLYSVGSQPSAVITPDLNGDHKPDIVVADRNVLSIDAGNLYVLLRDPKGGFAAPVSHPLLLQDGAQVAAIALATGDMNGDGKADVVFVSGRSGASGSAGVLLGNGDGTFRNPSSVSMGEAPMAVLLNDLNGDGKLDVAASYQGTTGDPTHPGGVSVLLGNGDGTLKSPVTYAVGGLFPAGMVAGDFNGDGKLDLAVAAVSVSDYTTPGRLAILLGKGDGTFQPAVLSTVGTPAVTPTALAAADVNGDGKLDLIVIVHSGRFSATLMVLLGNGDGTFKQGASMPTDNNPANISLADLNGDGNLDLIVGHCCGLSDGTYLLGNGDGTFKSEVHFLSGTSPIAIAVTDFNGDGTPGLAIVGRPASSPGTLVAIESTLSPNIVGSSPKLTSVSAASGKTNLAPDSIATAYGTGLATGTAPANTSPLSTSLGGTSVTIQDSTAALTFAPLFFVSPGQVNYDIPATVATGPAIVTVTSGDGAVSSGTVNLSSVAPGVFTLNSAGLVAASVLRVSASGAQSFENTYQADSSGAVAARPIDVSPQSGTVYLLLYGTGIRNAPAGQVSVTIGGINAPVSFAGAQGAFIGLDQVNVQVPAALAGKGSVTIQLTAGGSAANAAQITIQ